MKSKKMEKEYIVGLLNRLNDDNYKDRLENLLNWYFSKADYYRLMYYILNIIALISPIISSSLSLIFGSPVITIFSVLSSVSVLLLSLFECQKRWKLYRTTLEKLKNATELFLQGIYNHDEFVTICEKIVLEENINWNSNVNKDKDTK